MAGRELLVTAPDTTRSRLLAALAELSRVRPEWRLGQTLTNLAATAGRLGAGGVWDLKDDEALAAARQLLLESIMAPVRQEVPGDALQMISMR